MNITSSTFRINKRIISQLTVFVMMVSLFTFAASATASKTDVPGRVYVFGEDSQYEFSDTKEYLESNVDNTYGTFFISGEVTNVTTKDGIPAYEVSEGNLDFFYNYGDTLFLNEDLDSWHLIEDKSKQIDGLKLDESIMEGTIILQTSTDKLNWVNAIVMANAFSTTPIRTESIYETQDVQLINGCYYRVIVAYQLRIRTEDSNFLFINTDTFDYKKCAEVYEFYAYMDTSDANMNVSTETYNLGSKVRTTDFDSYSGEETITKDDPHYGWDLGNFFVSGYTDEVKDSNGNMVFLKNVGDKVTLWFRLNQDINNLNGSENLSITADGAGSDQYFETPTMDFGRGTLIIRYTDHNNVKAEPTIYTNYLEANTSIGADTKVQLFEEGNYEVALDYQVTENKLIDHIGHYRIFFKFSIRNGNCMVYPFDVATGSELTNSSMTENGFRLDLAKSRYLKVNLKRERLTEGADGLVEDTRFNGPAQDGAEYTDEGIYTITVANEYTGQLTVKKIYVGTNSVLKAHITTGLSIPEINNFVAQGATISDDGTIQLANIMPVTDPTYATQAPTDAPSDVETQASEHNNTGDKETPPFVLYAMMAIIAVACIAAVTTIVHKKNTTNQSAKITVEESEGSVEE